MPYCHNFSTPALRFRAVASFVPTNYVEIHLRSPHYSLSAGFSTGQFIYHTSTSAVLISNIKPAMYHDLLPRWRNHRHKLCGLHLISMESRFLAHLLDIFLNIIYPILHELFLQSSHCINE